MNAKFAYFLGWMYSDGYIGFDKRCNSAVVKIKILKSDEKTLRLFSDITDWNFHYEKDRYVTMRKNSNDLAKRLIYYGVLPRKSYVNHMSLRRPKAITDELMPYFIRGYFDGNGYYTWESKKNYLLFCGCTAKCFNLFKDFQSYLSIHNIKSSIREQRVDFYALRIRTREDVKRFVELVFKDHLELVLDRKFEKVKTFLENYHTTRELQSIAKIGAISPLSNPEIHQKAMRTRKENIRKGISKPSMLGKHHSEETRKKMSEIMKAKAQLVHEKRSELLETPEGNKTTTQIERSDVNV